MFLHTSAPIPLEAKMIRQNVMGSRAEMINDPFYMHWESLHPEINPVRMDVLIVVSKVPTER